MQKPDLKEDVEAFVSRQLKKLSEVSCAFCSIMYSYVFTKHEQCQDDIAM